MWLTYSVLSVTCREQCRFIQHIRKVRTGETRGLPCQVLHCDMFGEWLVFGMYLKNRQATTDIRLIEHHATVEATWT